MAMGIRRTDRLGARGVLFVGREAGSPKFLRDKTASDDSQVCWVSIGRRSFGVNFLRYLPQISSLFMFV